MTAFAAIAMAVVIAGHGRVSCATGWARFGRCALAKLTTKARNAIPSGSFALPGRRYPIEDASHARNALARVSQHGSEEEKKKVRGAVSRRYPGIGQGSKLYSKH